MPPEKSRYPSPLFVVLITAGSVFGFEILIMVLFRRFGIDGVGAVFLDSACLLLLYLPILYRFVYRPFVRTIERDRELEREQARLIGELQDALAQVKTLTGLLPICAWCRRIRNDTDRWQEVEVYVRDHSDADFTHTICPECYEREMKQDL